MLTAEEIITQALPHECPEGHALAVPGVQCTECGALPAMTREEALEYLSRPGAVEDLNASKLRAEAFGLYLQAEGQCQEADRIVITAKLHQEVTAALSVLKVAEADLSAAQEAYEAAQANADAITVADAEETHRMSLLDAENAKRTRKPAAEIIEAEWKAHRAEQLLRVVQQEKAAAVSSAQDAKRALEACTLAAGEARDALNRAEALASSDLPYIPMSKETFAVITKRFIWHLSELSQDEASGGPRTGEMLMFKALITSMAESTGLRTTWEANARNAGYAARKAEGNPLLSHGLG